MAGRQIHRGVGLPRIQRTVTTTGVRSTSRATGEGSENEESPGGLVCRKVERQPGLATPIYTMSESKEHRYAILIGNSEFQEEPSLKALRCPKNDAEGMAAVLTSPDFGLFTERQVFVNDPHGGVARAVN